MKRIITEESNYEEFPIMTNHEKHYGCDTKILKELKDQFDYAKKSKAKTFCMRYDIRFPQEEYNHTDNKKVREFQATFMKTLKREGYRPQYVLVREQSREKHQHYHGVLLLDGNKTQNITKHINTAERLWNKALGLEYEVQPGNQRAGHGLIDDCTHDRQGSPHENGIMLRRDDPLFDEKQKEAFRRASYLAKVNQKSSNPKGVREIFASRIPKEKD